MTDRLAGPADLAKSKTATFNPHSDGRRQPFFYIKRKPITTTITFTFHGSSDNGDCFDTKVCIIIHFAKRLFLD